MLLNNKNNSQVAALKGAEAVLDVGTGSSGALFNSTAAQHVLAAGAVLLLVDEGKLSLDTKVADVWPEFAANVSDKNNAFDVYLYDCSFMYT
jgi:hypothetical protein